MIMIRRIAVALTVFTLIPTTARAGEREDFLRMLLTANTELEVGLNLAELKASLVKIKSEYQLIKLTRAVSFSQDQATSIEDGIATISIVSSAWSRLSGFCINSSAIGGPSVREDDYCLAPFKTAYASYGIAYPPEKSGVGGYATGDLVQPLLTALGGKLDAAIRASSP